MQKKSATPAGAPWTLAQNAGLAMDYSPDMCPRALDLLNRAVYVGVDQWWTASDCDRVAAGINKVLGAYCAPHGQGLGWS
jgi:hypothetical protein